MSRSARLLVAALGGLLMLCACTSTAAVRGAAARPAAPPLHAIGRYVALGDSYTAAPLVGVTDLAGGCLRSEHDYPKLLAARLHVRRLVDVSCVAAGTRDLSRRQQLPGGRGSIAPQLDAVTRDTDLVTVGIGGNDEGLFERLAGRGRLRDLAGVRADIAVIGRHVGRAVRLVRARAPRATVVVVGYPRLAGPRPCAALPAAASQLPQLDDLTRLLRDRMRSAARSSGARFLDLYAASAGHDVCSSRPWVNGIRTRPRVALALHPLAAEQRAVAVLLARMLQA